MYDYEEIKKNLCTKYVSRNFIQFDYLDSISKKGMKICDNCPSGMLILCDYQDDVRISKNKFWKSKDLDQYIFSLILKRDEKMDYKNLLQRSVVLGLNNIFDTDEFSYNDSNDVFVDELKVGAVFVNESKKSNVNKIVASCYINKYDLCEKYESFYNDVKINEKIIATISNYFETLSGI